MRLSKAFAERVYAIVRQIPAGKVATYGQVATLIDSPRSARAVGMSLSALRFGSAVDDVPWQRVINAQGGISAPNDAHRHAVQRGMLEAEGVVFGPNGRCDLRVFGWQPSLSELEP